MKRNRSIITIAAAILLFATTLAANSSLAAPTGETNVKQVKVNLNQATLGELTTLPGVGTKKAEAIIAYRQKTAFQKPEDLLNVPGIGKKMYKKIQAKITTGSN